MQKVQPADDVEQNFQTDGGANVKLQNNIDSQEQSKYVQELTFYIMPVMIMYNSSKYGKFFKYRMFCMTMFMIFSHFIMIVMFKDLFQKGGESLDFSKGIFSLITRKSKKDDRRLFDIPSQQEINAIDAKYQNDFFLKFKNEFVKKVDRATKMNKVKRLMQQVSGTNSINFAQSPFFQNFATLIVNKMERAQNIQKVKQIAIKNQFKQAMKRLEFLNRARRRLQTPDCSAFLNPDTGDVIDETGFANCLASATTSDTTSSSDCSQYMDASGNIINQDAYDSCQSALLDSLFASGASVDCSAYADDPDPTVYNDCMSLSVSNGNVDLSTLDFSTIENLDFSEISDSQLNSYFESNPEGLLNLDYSQLEDLNYNTLKLTDTQLDTLFGNDPSVPVGTDFSNPDTLKYYLTTEPFNLSNQSQIAQMGAVNAKKLLQDNPKTADQSKGELNQQVILAIVKVCGIFMAFYMSVKKSAEGNHTHLFFHILEKRTNKPKRLGNFFGYYEIFLGFMLYITTFFVILGETNSIELIKDIAGLCILTDMDEWMCTYLTRNKEFMKEFEQPYLAEKYGYDDKNFTQNITATEQERYYLEHRKSFNTLVLRVFQFINDLMTMAMGAIVIAASQTSWS